MLVVKSFQMLAVISSHWIQYLLLRYWIDSIEMYRRLFFRPVLLVKPNIGKHGLILDDLIQKIFNTFLFDHEDSK